MHYMMSFVLEAVLGFLVGVFPLLAIFWLWQRREVRPVSYTNLDVYKRQ